MRVAVGAVCKEFLKALGITVVALLAGYLAERLRRTGGALVAATERAMAAERLAMLGRIATGLAHEIRNPLGSISGCSDDAETEVPTPEPSIYEKAGPHPVGNVTFAVTETVMASSRASERLKLVMEKSACRP